MRGHRVPRSTIAAGTVQALRLTYQLRTNCLSVTTDRTTVALGPLQPIRDVCFHGEFRRITGHSVDAKKAKRIRAGRFLPWTATRTDVCERASGETPVRETVDFKRELDKDFDIWPARGCG